MGLTAVLTHYLKIWGSILGQLVLVMPAFAVASFSIVMATEMDITLGDVWDSLRENYLDAVLMGLFLLPIIGGLQWLLGALQPTGEAVLGAALTRGFFGAVVTLVPFYFMMHLVDGKKGAITAFADGLTTLAPHFHQFLLLLFIVSLFFIGAGFVPFIGGFIMLGVEVLSVYALGSMYYEISGKEAQDEGLNQGSRDISKMPSVWKPGARKERQEPMGQAEKPEEEKPDQEGSRPD